MPTASPRLRVLPTLVFPHPRTPDLSSVHTQSIKLLSTTVFNRDHHVCAGERQPFCTAGVFSFEQAHITFVSTQLITRSKKLERRSEYTSEYLTKTTEPLSSSSRRALCPTAPVLRGNSQTARQNVSHLPAAYRSSLPPLRGWQPTAHRARTAPPPVLHVV